jgi:urease accessory protein
MPGEGAVAVAAGGAVTRLTAASPLKLLVPRNHGRAAWIFVANLGGGLLDGDRLRLSVDVAAGAAAYLTTQASTKVYPGSAAQETDAAVAAGGLLVALPDPVVCFAGARYEQRARVALAEGASLVWLESLSAGRVAHGERWELARYESRLDIDAGGRARVRDALLLDPAHGPLAARLGRFAALATLVALGPQAAPLRAAWLDAPPPAQRAPAIAAASPLGDDGAIVRVAAASVAELGAALAPLLAPIAALLGDDPLARKW